MTIRSKIIALIALICLGLLPLSAVQAAKIGKNSCGLGLGADPVPNAYCDFSGDSDGVKIGKDSCNVEGACTSLGNDLKIGNNSCPFSQQAKDRIFLFFFHGRCQASTQFSSYAIMS